MLPTNPGWESQQKEKLVVIGQGYVGLPLAMRAVEAGFDVVGLDFDDYRIEKLKAGKSYVEDISDALLGQALSSGSYSPTSSYADASNFSYAVITVPTPLKERVPDLSFINSSVESIAPYVTRGSTVILESTTYPGTTEELVTPQLERLTSLRGGSDFYVGYSPERIDPGNPVWNFKNTPKVVSGINPESLESVHSFYSQLVDVVVPVSGTKEAELTKLLENTFRHVNIALVNELAVFANQLGVNTWEAIEAASSKPFGFMKFTPGPGVGGHCLPVDPSYLSWEVKRKLGRSFRFVDLANDVNEHMPDYVVQRVMSALNQRGIAINGARVTILGLAYKKNSGDIRESPSQRLTELLLEGGAQVQALDPHVDVRMWPNNVERLDSLQTALEKSEIVILVTDHDDFDYSMINNSSVPVLDTRNRLDGELVELM